MRAGLLVCRMIRVGFGSLIYVGSCWLGFFELVFGLFVVPVSLKVWMFCSFFGVFVPTRSH